VILLCLSAVIFLTSGGVPRPRRRKRGAKKNEGEVGQKTSSPAVTTADNRAVAQVGAAPKQAKPAKQGKGGDDDGLDPEVAAILRRHGIS
jgi:hypothetical protein